MSRISQKIGALVLSAALALGVCPIGAAPAFAQADNGSGMETDGVLITLDESASAGLLSNDAAQSQVADKLAQAGMEITGSLESASGETMITAQAPSGQTDEEAAEAALQVEGVAAAQPNYVYHLIDDLPEEDAAASDALTSDPAANALLPLTLEGAATPLAQLVVNDPFTQVSSSSAKNNQYWAYGWQAQQNGGTNLVDAWAETGESSTVGIAVMDSFINLDHEDLAANIDVEHAFDAVSAVNDGNGTYRNSNYNPAGNGSHGTHVTGIAAAVANNGKGLAGASKNATVIPINVVSPTGSITTAYLAEAFNYVLDHPELGVRVINLSLGGYGASATYEDAGVFEAIDAAKSQGILTVCAGGNGTKPEQIKPDGTYNNIWPADYDSCMAVTALKADGTNVVASDFNAQKDISAPGASIYSTLGTGASAYGSKSGSSMASPVVAGIAALLFAAYPETTVDEVSEAIYVTANKVVDPENDRTQTSGSHGAIDAEAALAYLAENVDPQPEPVDFPDVHEGDWFYDAVQYVADRGIMTGDANTREFMPNDPTMREQMAQVLYNYLGNGETAPNSGKNDVMEDWYTPAVSWVVSEGFINGYDDGSNDFGIGDSLTREQLAIILANVSGEDISTANDAKFNSISGHEETSPWAREAMIWACDKGLISGEDLGGGVFVLNPTKDVTRAQLATIIMRAIEVGVL